MKIKNFFPDINSICAAGAFCVLLGQILLIIGFVFNINASNFCYNVILIVLNILFGIVNINTIYKCSCVYK